MMNAGTIETGNSQSPLIREPGIQLAKAKRAELPGAHTRIVAVTRANRKLQPKRRASDRPTCDRLSQRYNVSSMNCDPTVDKPRCSTIWARLRPPLRAC
ncbi:hypothetical protein Q31a_53400 [Aureliella helgolandensis]|uniref:Uncharacterized protein n=1 Tax=Aureliella helgolandensis TaxID=2527968 RepID=A0A518GEH6_9BACT|nr:hypothetical protein Q31a_53400 [Aureliella helgolandensis]